MVEIIDLFAAECAEELPALATSLAGEDFERGSRVAHSLKGSLGSLHAARARRHAADLEMAARERNALDYARALASLSAEITTLQTHLSNFRQSCLCR
jgi:HPt (histidine-containing phosphotransfer) domain-containing protein